MDRPLADKRPVGPFVESSGSGVNGIALVYTTSNVRDFPSTRQLEVLLDDAYRQARQEGISEVVASDPDVSVVGSPRADTRAIRVNTGATIMNMDQFEEVKRITDEIMSNAGSYSTVAVAVSNP